VAEVTGGALEAGALEAEAFTVAAFMAAAGAGVGPDMDIMPDGDTRDTTTPITMAPDTGPITGAITGRMDMGPTATGAAAIIMAAATGIPTVDTWSMVTAILDARGRGVSFAPSAPLSLCGFLKRRDPAQREVATKRHLKRKDPARPAAATKRH
jgi:hypothetical protein